MQLLMRLGHFIFTPWHAGARRCVRTTVPCSLAVLPAVFPGPERFVPAYANLIASIRENETAAPGRERERRERKRERFFQNTSADANNRQKNNNCFYSRENTSSKPASRCKVDRQVSRTLDKPESSLILSDLEMKLAL